MCAVLAGASSVTAIADWLHDLDDIARARLGFLRAVPATTTMWRLLIRVDADLLATVLAGWLHTRTRPALSQRPRYRQVIAVDGKTVRGARRADGSQVHLLSALDTSTGIVLAQVTVNAKSNEIPAFTPLLDAIAQLKTLSRTGFDGDIETWKEDQRCLHRGSTPMSCVSVRPGWSLRPVGIRPARSARSGGSPISSESTRRRCGRG